MLVIMVSLIAIVMFLYSIQNVIDVYINLTWENLAEVVFSITSTITLIIAAIELYKVH